MRLSGFQLGLLASIERTEVVVAKKPRVTVLCTGDELRPAGSAWSEGDLAESNSVALAALIESAGAEVCVGPVVKDDGEEMKTAILYQSLRGGTERLAHSIAENFQTKGSSVGTYPITNIDAQFVLRIFIVLIFNYEFANFKITKHSTIMKW